MLLIATDWAGDGVRDFDSATLRETIQGIHDVLVKAADTDRALVEIVCSNLGGYLRDILWHEVTGSTFADQLGRVLERSGQVRIFVNRTAMEHGPVASSVFQLFGEYQSADRFQLNFKADEAHVPNDFPHFTMAKLAAKDPPAWYACVEWAESNQLPGPPETWKLNDPVRASLYGQTQHADEVCRLLSLRFEELSRPATTSKVTL